MYTKLTDKQSFRIPDFFLVKAKSLEGPTFLKLRIYLILIH